MNTSHLQTYANTYAELVAKHLATFIFDTQRMHRGAKDALMEAAGRIHETAMGAAYRLVMNPVRQRTNNKNGKGRKMRNSSKKPTRKDTNIVPNAGKKTPSVKRSGKGAPKTKKSVARK